MAFLKLTKNMIKTQQNKILGFFGVLIAIFILAVLLYRPVIFQEGNPWPQIKGIMQLKFSDADIVQLSGSDNKFMTESKNGMVIHDFMETKGYEFTGQMGSGYFFKSPTGQSAVATHKYYSRYYSLWTITENSNDTNNNLWTAISNEQGITFQYPKELLAKYISVAEWPPVVKIETGVYLCKTTPQEGSMSDITSERLVDDRIYCVNVKHEGAAGSVYSSYTYTTPKNAQLITISFALRYPNCNNYDEEQNMACASEREVFDVDGTIDRIAQSIQLKDKQKSIVDELKECLSKSDTASHEKCNELLKQINNYDSCVDAGFSIMKSNLPQCATPDGRTFTQETNSTWEQALSAINNCEVKNLFQTHSRIVTLTLKNGNRLIAQEPKIDDIITIVRSVESECGKIPIGTE